MSRRRASSPRTTCADWKRARSGIGEDARLTPLAADIVNESKIEFVRRVSRRGSKASKLIAVGADHGGFQMKEELKGLLGELGHKCRTLGRTRKKQLTILILRTRWRAPLRTGVRISGS